MPRLGDCGSVKNAVPLQSNSNSNDYPLNVSELIKQLLVENPEMVSVQVNEEFAEREDWHSHPASPSRPSQEDLRLANDPTIRYAILSLHEGVHLNSFKIQNGEVVDKEVHL